MPADPDSGVPATELDVDHDGDNTVRRASAAALGLVALATGATGGYLLGSRHSDTTTVASAPVQLSTVKVQQLDLVTYDETTATLGFTTSATVSSPVAGTVTSVVAGGDTVDAGTVVATIDGAPVVAMIGDIPGYRDLSTSSTDGADIRQLELNLVQLGFDPDHKIVIDETYGSATKAAETAWEDSLGLTGDGKITKGELVFIPGRLLIDTVSATVGGSVNAGSALVVGRQAERKYLVAGLAGATIDHQAPVGTKVATGTVLYWSNGFPVMAIEGDATATPALGRDLSDGVTDGVDVKLFEQALDALGFDADSTMVVDDHFDAATATAATAWVASLGITADPATLVVPAGSFTVVPAGLSIGTPLITDGTVLEGDGVVLSLTTPSRQVTTTAPIGDDTFKLGAKIDVEFPDRTVQPVSPVVALDGALPAWRSLSTSSVDGADVAQLETSLVALGYDPALKVTVDNHFDSASRTMVKAWQKGLGVEQTGKVALGWVVFLPSGTTVSAVSQAVGNTIGDGDTVMTLAAPTQEVLVDVPAGDEAKVVPGLAVEIGDVQGAVVRLRSADRDGTVTVEAVIAPAPPIANATNGSAVKVTLTLQDDSGVLLAPAEALVSQLDGSYAVQVQTSDGTTKWLTVELLGVSGGNVALKGADLTDGTVVLLPA